MPALAAEVIEKARVDHPRGKLLTAGNGEQAFVRPPTRGEYRAFRAASMDDRKKPDAIEDLVRACVVVPSKADFAALLETYPALCEEFAEHVFALAGISQNVRAEG